MNKAIVVFLKSEALVTEITERGIWVKGTNLNVTLLYASATKVTVSNLLPVIDNELILKELARCVKVVSDVKTIPLGCKSQNTKARYVF